MERRQLCCRPGPKGRQAFNATRVAAACANFAQVRTAILFGSRAKGNYRNGSDVDIALEIDGDGYDMCLALADYLNEETLMPYHFDMIDLAAVDNAELLDQVSRQGRELYRRPT